VDALDQLRKLTLSFSEIRYLAVEHTEADIRAAVESLLTRTAAGAGPGEYGVPLIVQVPNLANLPIYRITPVGRDLVLSRKAAASAQATWPMP
jgi:hypothetical protein